MAIDLKLLDGADVIMVRPREGTERGDIDRIRDLLALIEVPPRGLLLDWSEFARGSFKGTIQIMTEASALAKEWQPRRIAVLAPENVEKRISLLIRRKAGTAEVRRFELDREDEARAWLTAP